MFLPLLCLVAAITLPPPTSTNVADGAGLLTDNERATLVEQIQLVKANRAVNIGVITIDQLDDDPKSVAVRTLNYWQMGPDSVLLLVSLQPRKLYLQPGSNLAYLFDNTNSSTITNSMVPFMKRKDTLGALLEGIRKIDSTLQVVGTKQIVPTSAPEKVIPIKPDEPNRYTEKSNAGSIALGLTLLFLAIIAGGAIGLAMSRNKKRRYDALDRETGYAPLRQQSAFIPPPSLQPVYAAEKPAPTVKQVVQPRSAIAQVDRRQSAPPVTQTVVVESPSNDNLATGILIGQALERSAPPPVYVPPPSPPRRTYSPPPSPPRPRYSPPAPRYSPPSTSSWGDSGGGSSWGSDSGGSSDGGGGGGSDW